MPRNPVKEILYVLFVSFVISHFVISLGQIENFLSLFAESYYWIDLSYVTAITFAVIFSLYKTHRWLDRIYPFQENTKRRILFQILWVIVTPCLITLIFAWIYLSLILGYNFFETSFLQYEYPVSILIIVICNLVLSMITLVKNRIATSDPAMPSAPVQKDVLLVQQGSRKVPVDTGDIAAIYKEGDVPVLFTFSGKQFSMDEPLDQVFATLDARTFFRANRQAIINLRICEHFVINRSGKIDLKLGDPVNKDITVSQKKARDFKAWISQS